MIVGSESSRFWVIKLNRTTDAAGLVQVAPEITFSTEAWDQEVLNANGDNKAPVASSVAVYEDIVYFCTTAGLILGSDLGSPREGGTPDRVSRSSTGGDHHAPSLTAAAGAHNLTPPYDRPPP